MEDYVFVASKAVGVAAAILATAMKVPQVVRLLNAKSDRGVDLTVLLLEIYCYSLGAIYGYLNSLSLTAYGETLLLTFQDIILICTVFAYRRKLNNAALFCALFAMFVAFLLHGPGWVREIFLVMTLPIVILGNGMDISQLYKAKSARSVSLTICVLTAFCSISRVFTTVVEVKDNGVLLNFSVASVMNVIIVGQVVLYQRLDAKRAKQE